LRAPLLTRSPRADLRRAPRRAAQAATPGGNGRDTPLLPPLAQRTSNAVRASISSEPVRHPTWMPAPVPPQSPPRAICQVAGCACPAARLSAFHKRLRCGASRARPAASKGGPKRAAAGC
jgi:hypothetical protein